MVDVVYTCIQNVVYEGEKLYSVYSQ